MNAYQEKLKQVLESLVVHTANEYGGFEGFDEDGARDGLHEATAAINALNAETLGKDEAVRTLTKYKFKQFMPW